MEFPTRSVVLAYVLLLSGLKYRTESIHQTIELPINAAVKTIELQITQLDTIILTIKCLNYDALKDLDGSVLKHTNWAKDNQKLISFTDCYNNETSHDNFKKFQLEEFLQTDPNSTFEDISIYFEKFAILDENVFLKNFKFSQYTSLYFKRLAFLSTEFLSNLISNTEIEFVNCNSINFNHFINNSLTAVVSKSNEIVNFNSNNLGKLPMLLYLELDNNIFQDDIFNVPDLFKLNSKLFSLSIDSSRKKLKLHENVFSGLIELETLTLINNQIEHIPQHLFDDLTNIKSISLDENRIKSLHENTFLKNPNLSFLSMDENNLLIFSGTTNNINFGASKLHLSLEEVAYSSVAQLENILNNPNVERLSFNKFTAPLMSFEDFGLIKRRSGQITASLHSGETFFNMSLTLNESLSDMTDYGTIFEVHISKSDRMCRECNLMKPILSSVHDDVYAANDKLSVLFKFILTLDCRRLIKLKANKGPECS